MTFHGPVQSQSHSVRTRWAHNPRSVGNLVVWCIWIYHCHKLHHRIWWSSASWLESLKTDYRAVSSWIKPQSLLFFFIIPTSSPKGFLFRFIVHNVQRRLVTISQNSLIFVRFIFRVYKKLWRLYLCREWTIVHWWSRDRLTECEVWRSAYGGVVYCIIIQLHN